MKSVTYIGHGEFGNLRVKCGNLVSIEEGRTDHLGNIEYFIHLESGGVAVTIPTSRIFALVEGVFPLNKLPREWRAFEDFSVLTHARSATRQGAKTLMLRTRSGLTDHREDKAPAPVTRIGHIGQLILDRINAA